MGPFPVGAENTVPAVGRPEWEQGQWQHRQAIPQCIGVADGSKAMTERSLGS